MGIQNIKNVQQYDQSVVKQNTILTFFTFNERGKLMLKYKKSDGTFGTLMSEDKDGKPHIYFIDSLVDGKINVNGTLPAWIKTNKDNFYAVEKLTLTFENNVYKIDPAPYLAYDNSQSFEGIWQIYCLGANGLKGDPGEDGKDGQNGKDGKDGENGKDGVDGKDAPLTDYFPNVTPTFRDDEFGVYCRLDNSYPTIDFVANIIGLKKIRLHYKTADDTVSGNAKLLIKLDSNTMQNVLSVNNTWQWAEIENAMSGKRLKIERDTTSSQDTLKKSGTTISLIIDAIQLIYQR